MSNEVPWRPPWEMTCFVYNKTHFWYNKIQKKKVNKIQIKLRQIINNVYQTELKDYAISIYEE